MVGSTFSTLSNLYAAEGVAGLYRGFIPRSIHMLPVYFSIIATVKMRD